MKFQGESVKAVATGSVKLPRPGGKFLEFKIRATGLGDEAKGERLFPDARPPVDFLFDKKGGIVRDPKTDKPLRETNYYDAAFVTKQEEASRMQMVVSVVDALSEDPALTWDTDAVVGTREFYLATFTEMQAAGITFGDMKLIRQASQVLGNLDQKALEAAAEGFSAQGEAEASA